MDGDEGQGALFPVPDEVGAGWRCLGPLDGIEDQGACGYPPPPGSFIGLVAVRRNDKLFVYKNSCPHIGVSLDWMPNQFLNEVRTRIVCATHGALFDIENGVCLSGPCLGDQLTRVAVQLIRGQIWVYDAE